jgi:hypothetical protein
MFLTPNLSLAISTLLPPSHSKDMAAVVTPISEEDDDCETNRKLSDAEI